MGSRKYGVQDSDNRTNPKVMASMGTRLLLANRQRCYATSLRFPYVLHTSTTRQWFSSNHNFDASSPDCNVSVNIQQYLGRNLHQRPLHPLNTIHRMICEYWNTTTTSTIDKFAVFDDISPIVSTHHCFDVLRIPPDHVSRKTSDTYYVNATTVLRPHTSAHQVELLQSGLDRFLVTGDVYRRDEIDRSHYPVFHQMEGVKMFSAQQLHGLTADEQIQLIENDLKQGLEGMARHLFGPVQMRWAGEYFPFTDPSFELEIFYDNEWMEVLGCGVIHPDIVKNAGREGAKGWAFGLGLERLAMVLFQIPDIRLFWTDDERFHKQFESGQIVAFKPYSKYPACLKDISFWIPDDYFHVNDLNEVVRDVAGDLVEQLELVDQFQHPKTHRTSHCYRITYRSMDRSLTNVEIDALQEQVRLQTVARLNVELR